MNKKQVEETLWQRQNEALARGKKTANALLDAMKNKNFMVFFSEAPKIVENSLKEQLRRGETVEI